MKSPSIYKNKYGFVLARQATVYLNWFLSKCVLETVRHDLVGGFNPSEKYDFVSWDDDSQPDGKS